MNKYKKAIEVIDTLLHLMCGEEREDGYKPTMEEMSNSMDLLKDLANKADAFEWIPVTERLPEQPKENRELDYSMRRNKMTAREMFESLGYTLIRSDNCFISYEKNEINALTRFVFVMKDKKFYSEYNAVAHDITMDELKAVNKQVEELGWI